MVVCFLIHTVGAVGALSPCESRVLYSRVFGVEEEDEELSGELEPEKRRLARKERLGVVARQVRSAVCLSREASGSVCVEAVLGEEAVALGEAECGVLSLGRGEPFAGPSVALWLGVQAMAFTMVCQPHENLLLAEGTLRNLTRHCLEELRLLGTGSEVGVSQRMYVCVVLEAAATRILMLFRCMSCLGKLALRSANNTGPDRIQLTSDILLMLILLSVETSYLTGQWELNCSKMDF
uniref:Adaptor related protein complex 5 subunit sigma 1 n=1 Tax=Astyanax mexicanus TaxID=7994 RepID=A0A3B1J093_ASTMX